MERTKKTLWIVSTAFRYCFKYIFVYIFVTAIMTLVDVGMRFLMKNIVNSLELGAQLGKFTSTIAGLIIAYMLLYMLRRVSGFTGAFGKNFYRLNVDMFFRKIFMWRAYNTPQEKFFETEFNEKYSFASGAVGRISDYIQIWVSLIVYNIGSIVSTVAIFAVYEPYLILPAIVVSAVTAAVYVYVSKKRYELDKRQVKEQRSADYYRSLLTGKENAKELRVYRTQNHFFKKWLEKYNKLRVESLSLELEQEKLNSILVLVRFVLRILTTAFLTVGVYFSRYDVGTFVMLFGLVEGFTSQVYSLVSSVVKGAYKEVKYLCDYYDFIMPITKEEIRTILSGSGEADSDRPYGDFSELSVEHVSYTYPGGDRKAVDDVSLTLKKGEIVSILGYNGSGKTTLSKLINGSLNPQSGVVKLNGVPVSQANRNEIFSYFGLAPQEFSRFSLQIREIVGLGDIRKMNDPAELEKAYSAADLQSFLAKYELGDETSIGKDYDENGVELSGGEWQRLVIASSYIGEPEILIMDEPTASIDPMREMEMLSNFRRNLGGRTAVLISHRIGFARLADRIIMMENGKITESGTHEELIASGGYYARLFSEQKKLYEDENEEKEAEVNA